MNPIAPRRVADLQEELTRLAERRVFLILTDNRRSMIAARRKGDFVEVRLQRLFLQSPTEVVKEIGNLLAGRRTDRSRIQRFVAEAFRERPRDDKPREPSPARTASEHHDIVGYAVRLNAAYLGGRSTARVMWGRRNRSRSPRSIRFGCYDPSRNVIIMNRKLDSPGIPAYFVEYILFHEMLHEVLGMDVRVDGKRDIHGGLFKLMESTYPDFDKARRYEKDLCKRLGSL